MFITFKEWFFMKNKVTMQDIANKLKISKNSVSQALTGKDGVSEETRKMVFETAKQMGYIYPRGGKRKSQNSARSIALIASDFAFAQKSFFGEIYLSIEQETSLRGIHLHIQSINQEAEKNLILPPFLHNQIVDGVLILSHITAEYIQTVLSTGIPTVLIDHHHPRIYADCILTNNRFGAYNAVQYLINLGHHKIGFVGDIRFSPSYYERLEGFMMALGDYEIAPNPSFIIKDAVEKGDFINEKLSQMEQLPTAWFCANDGLGFLIHSGLQQLGKKIPDDVSVCSFDNGQLSQISSPATTTVGINLKLFGRKAVEQLLWRIENKGEPFMEILLPTTLIKRESTAPWRD
jgi:LacI family transcriptional regulator